MLSSIELSITELFCFHTILFVIFVCTRCVLLVALLAGVSMVRVRVRVRGNNRARIRIRTRSK